MAIHLKDLISSKFINSTQNKCTNNDYIKYKSLQVNNIKSKIINIL